MKKQRKLSFLLVFLLCLSLPSLTFAQDGEITGKVTDTESGEGIPGVSVIIKGTSRGAITDLDGSFSIRAGSEEVLAFSFLGYVTVEETVANRSVINVGLSQSIQALTEVVVVGYGTQERKEITSAVTSVKAENFNQGTVNDPRQLLQGKVAGLNIARPGGNPNGGFNMRLRGISSI
ncbi:carboxypeptidase-like regulatory domain-containing protein, partial [Algoriphagus aquimarinus]|uniref:carboxypeptidase-like regulatory domain-containing protein n=1 Tax=Algoriphagus aquimarinus TaxID=237018 RepID=UPI0030DDBE8C